MTRKKPFTTTGTGKVRFQVFHTKEGRIHQILVTFLETDDVAFLRNLGDPEQKHQKWLREDVEKGAKEASR